MPNIWQPINAITFLQRGNDAIRRAEEAVREGGFRLELNSVRIVSPILHPGQVIQQISSSVRMTRIVIEFYLIGNQRS